MLSKATLKQKLYMLASSLLIFSVILGGVSIWGISTLDTSIKLLVDQSIPSIT